MAQIITNNGGGGGVGLYKYKGSVDYYEDLPSSGMKIGDVYNVVNAFSKDGKDYPAGTNVAWTGTDWDPLGGSIDLSDYQKKLVEGSGIDINQTTNEISVESTVISGAALGATAIQPLDNISALTNDAGYIDNTVDNLTNYTKTSDLAAVALSNDYDDLNDKPTIGDATITIQKNGTKVDDFGVNDTSNTTVNITMDKSDVGLSNVDNTSDLDKPISTATQSALNLKANSADLATVATTGDYDDLIDKPTIGNATLTIQRNGTNVNTFTANATSNVTANISVPTKTSDISNDSGFITKSVNNLDNYTLTTSLASVATSGSYNDLSNKPSIPTKTSDLNNDSGFIDKDVNNLTNYTLSSSLATVATSGSYTDLSDKPTIGDATIKIQKNSTDIDSFTTNATSGKTINISVPTTVAELSDSSDYALNSSLAAVATSGSYADLSNKPTIGTANLTIQKNGTTVATFGANATSGVTANIAVPTKTSDLTNDSNFVESTSLASVATSGDYDDLTNKPTIGNATLTIQKNSTTIDTFTANATSNKTINIGVPTTVAELSDSSDYAKVASLATVATSGAYSDLSGTPNLATVATTGDYDDLIDKPTIPSVIDNLTSTSTTNALSANQGKVLKDMIDDLSALGKFLSLWDSTTGLPISFPQATPYTYSTGDYYLVETIGTTNYKPTGSSYTGTASTTVETEEVEVGDIYIYDGTTWLLQLNHGKTVSFANLTGSPSDNAALDAALDAKADTSSLATVATSGSYNDLSNKPTIPTVNDATLTIQKNGTTVKTFTANASSNVTANITVPTKTSDITNDSGYITSSDLSGYQTTANMVTSLTGADNTHYPTAKAVADALSGAGNGDMLKATYDPNNVSADAFDYDNFINTPNLAAVATSGAYSDLSGTPTLASVATSGSYNDLSNKPTIPAAQIQSDWTQADNTKKDYIKNKPSLATVATSGLYSDLTGTPTLATVATSGSYNDLSNKPTIPTVNDATLTIQKNGTTVKTFTANASSNVTANITVPTKTSDISNDSGYITKSVNNLDNYTLSSALATVATTGSYSDLSNKPTIPTDTSDLTNGAGFITGITSSDVTTALGYTPYNSSNPSGYVTSSIISDTAYGSGWNSDTTHAPTKNAVYDKLNAMDTTISGKQAALATQTAYTSKGTSTKVPTITTNTLGQVTAISETNIAFPVTSVNGSTGAVTVQPTLVSGTNIKTVNGNSLLGSGNVSVGTLTAETVVSGDSGTTYTIKVSSSEPGSSTPSTTITFVTA